MRAKFLKIFFLWIVFIPSAITVTVLFINSEGFALVTLALIFDIPIAVVATIFSKWIIEARIKSSYETYNQTSISAGNGAMSMDEFSVKTYKLFIKFLSIATLFVLISIFTFYVVSILLLYFWVLVD